MLSRPTAPRARLRELLATGTGPLVAPGAYDALTARLVEQAGFDAVYMTGFGTMASLRRSGWSGEARSATLRRSAYSLAP
ncbi:hypothetical protein [Pseudonocardia aurantiaca]|uniref:Carboxyvinyl-carboxyphosphonate phosphorylmutase n=1 Tax=Pseudonocardia aurantiaca TaxID=75290 RepID=A0ABW4FW81_9PSEU